MNKYYFYSSFKVSMWNWQYPSWPNSIHKIDELWLAQAMFERECGIFVGASQHLSAHEQQNLHIELLTQDATSTSEIEGEILDSNSVQSSIQRHLGLKAPIRSAPAEAGIAELMVDLYRNAQNPIDEARLYHWHSMIMNGRRYVGIGSYRDHSEPMQVISGALGKENVHYEAPPSSRVPHAMKQFIGWLNNHNTHKLPSIAVAGIAHIWFESIHPFEDGNGRIGRAISEKILSTDRQNSSLLTLISPTIIKHKKQYYDQLHTASVSLDITGWLRWFACIAIESQRLSTTTVKLIIEKHTRFSKHKETLNERQKKALSKLYQYGVGGFTGGMSASNYRNITGATQPTATRDLNSLVDISLLTKTGDKKSTRYWLNTSIQTIEQVLWSDIMCAASPPNPRIIA